MHYLKFLSKEYLFLLPHLSIYSVFLYINMDRYRAKQGNVKNGYESKQAVDWHQSSRQYYLFSNFFEILRLRARTDVSLNDWICEGLMFRATQLWNPEKGPLCRIILSGKCMVDTGINTDFSLGSTLN